MRAPTAVDGGDKLPGDIDGLDDWRNERVRRLDAVEERRVQLTRLDEHAADVRRRHAQFRRQRAVQRADAGLGGGVVGQLRGAKTADDAGHGHNGAAAGGAAHQRGEKGLEAVKVRQEVGGHAGVDVFEGHVEERLANDDGSIVDEDRRRAEL